MRNKIIVFLLLCISLIFSGCFSSWQEETGTIILNLGSNSRAALPPSDEALDKLEYEVTFTGAKEEFTLNSKGREPVKATVIPGDWKITVKAFTYVDYYNSTQVYVRERIMYAMGKETVKVKPGQSNPVAVRMSNMGEVGIFIDVKDYNDKDKENYIFTVTGIPLLSEVENDTKEYFYYESHNSGYYMIEIESGVWYFTVEVYLGSKDDGSKASTDPCLIIINPGYNDSVITFSPVSQ